MQNDRDYGVPLLQPLNAHQLEYRGVNSRTPTIEFAMITGIKVTPKAAEAWTEERRKEVNEQARAKYAAKSYTEAQLKRSKEQQRASYAARKAAGLATTPRTDEQRKRAAELERASTLFQNKGRQASYVAS
ncbi:hypothetical protein DL762_003444 [Monosporascus cannonballus]|uniref:Uncharacterized protein n=1 Tax=Monosporascus cannonballus TaxID=155416 RepID=A0ABY0HDK1_9PEZI|nr:hypothetical protein DL762_003444 [Monosporascus cannonballus]